MKRLYLYGQKDIRLVDQPLPEEVAPRHIRVKTDITAVSTGTERALYTCVDPHWSEVIRGPLPYDMGYNNVGRVIAAGSEVSRFEPGDRVYSIAPHTSEYDFAEDGAIVKVPASVKSEDAVFTHLAMLGRHALQRGDFEPGMYVSVIGLGIIGLCTVALAKAVGARVVAVGRGAARIEAARRLGADLALDSEAPDCVERAIAFAGESGIDIAVLIANTWSSLRSACEMVRKCGTISMIGFPGVGDRDNYSNPFDASWFYAKRLTFASVSYVPRGTFAPQDVRWNIVRYYEHVLDLMEQGKLSLAHIVTHRCSYHDAVPMYERIASGDRDIMGLIFEWGETI